MASLAVHGIGYLDPHFVRPYTLRSAHAYEVYGWLSGHSIEMALFWSLFTGGSFLVDYLENEIVGFDENLAVVLLCNLQQCVMLRKKPEAFVCERHRETLTWSPMGK